LVAILEFTITCYFFQPENDFSGFLDPQNLDKDTKFITPVFYMSPGVATPGELPGELCKYN